MGYSIIEYVLGFAFDHEGRVALIQKKRPDWQAGRWNGIGGHRDTGETSREAMAREFKEEAGVDTFPEEWTLRGRMRCEARWVCSVYSITLPKLAPRTMTDERVAMFEPHAPSWALVIENIPVLIELCRMKPDHTGMIPQFVLDYT